MNPSSQSSARRKLYTVAKEIGLLDSERIELACYLLRRNIGSWKELDEDQVLRMLDALEGHHLVTTLLEQRV